MQNILLLSMIPHIAEKNVQRCSFRHQYEGRAQQGCEY